MAPAQIPVGGDLGRPLSQVSPSPRGPAKVGPYGVVRKPTIAGKAGDKLILGLPGHPAAALLVFRALMGAVLKQWGMVVQERVIPASIAVNLPSAPGKTTFQMVRLEQKEDGFSAVPVFGKSGMIHLLGQSDGYIIMQAHQEGLEQGQQVLVHML